MKRRKAQSTLEYAIILAAIIGAIVLIANTILKPKLQASYSGLTDKMEQKVNDVEF
jgi:Flp pilus assembly pilin Flp